MFGIQMVTVFVNGKGISHPENFWGTHASSVQGCARFVNLGEITFQIAYEYLPLNA